MPAWVRTTVKKLTKTVTSGTPVTFETDPSFVNEIAAADAQRDYINIEQIGTNVTFKAWRHEGARPDLMLQLDDVGSPVLSVSGVSGLQTIDWPAGAGAARKLTFEVTCAVGTETITLENDTVFRTNGD